MNARTQVLAGELASITQQIADFIHQCTEAEWRTITEGEHWPVCSVCRHIARGFEIHPQVIRLAANGEAMPTGYTWEDIHQSNAEQARCWAGLAKEDVLVPLHRYSDEAVTFIGDLDDKQLDQITKSPLDEGMVSVQQMVEGMIDHVRIHLESVRATIERDEGAR